MVCENTVSKEVSSCLFFAILNSSYILTALPESGSEGHGGQGGRCSPDPHDSGEQMMYDSSDLTELLALKIGRAHV